MVDLHGRARGLPAGEVDAAARVDVGEVPRGHGASGIRLRVRDRREVAGEDVVALVALVVVGVGPGGPVGGPVVVGRPRVRVGGERVDERAYCGRVDHSPAHEAGRCEGVDHGTGRGGLGSRCGGRGAVRRLLRVDEALAVPAARDAADAEDQGREDEQSAGLPPHDALRGAAAACVATSTMATTREMIRGFPRSHRRTSSTARSSSIP